MDYQRFIAQLPNLYENWGQDSIKPKSEQFHQVLDRVQGMTTANVMQLLNFAVECMGPEEIYCEIGTYQGSTLIGALLNHSERMAYAVDNFSEFDADGANLDKLINNLSEFGLQEQVCFCDQDFEEFLLELRDLGLKDKIGVYFYDGAHDYRSQILGLSLIRPFLSEKALIIIDDSNWGTVQQAIWDFVAINLECEVLLDLKTPIARYPTFWNGINILSWDEDRTFNYPYSTFSEMRHQPVIQSIYKLQLLEQEQGALDTLYQEALSLHSQRQFAAAQKKYKEFLLWRDDDANAWLNLGILYYEFEYYKESIESLLNSMKIAPELFFPHFYLGLIFEKLNRLHSAITAYKQAIALAPNETNVHNNLANLLTQVGEVEQAEAVCRQAITAIPSNFSSYLNLGNILLEQNQLEQAIEAYQTALTLSPDNPDILNGLSYALKAQNNPAQFSLDLGNKFYQQGRYREALEHYRKVSDIKLRNAEFFLNLSECFRHLNRGEESISTLEAGIELFQTNGGLRFYLIKSLHPSGQTQRAIASANAASKLLPNEYVFKLLKNLILPLVYDTPDEVIFYRQRFIQGLQDLIQQTSLKSFEDTTNALTGISCVTNFYLAYQTYNLLEAQSQYGSLVHRIMAANYPKWVEPLTMPPLKEGSKIRIGYVSAYLHSYSGTFWLTGWLRHCERQNFEIYCYYTGNAPDPITQQFRDYSDVFHHISGNLEAVCQQIIADELHILAFPEIGMDAPTMQAASLRLAPVQCTAWGHPVTSGLPTIDYYLSSDLMEAENAQHHYSETLIRLPNIGVSYPKPDMPQLTKTRSDFQLRDDAVVYLCCQAPFKYLPQHDFIFTEIAQRIPQAQFVFIRANLIQQRLQRAFAAIDLNSDDYCVFLPVQARPDYLMLNLLSDIYLDSLGFTGGNTTLDAIACNLPVVTCPCEFMRGRLSYAMLRMIGMTETIAHDEAQYVEIAVRLALDPSWRQEIVQYLATHHDLLYNDKVCVSALEAFYKQVVQERLSA